MLKEYKAVIQAETYKITTIIDADCYDSAWAMARKLAYESSAKLEELTRN